MQHCIHSHNLLAPYYRKEKQRRLRSVDKMQLWSHTHVNEALCKIESRHVTLFNIALHQTGELDQPDVHPIFILRSPAFRQGTFCQI